MVGGRGGGKDGEEFFFSFSKSVLLHFMLLLVCAKCVKATGSGSPRQLPWFMVEKCTIHATSNLESIE